MKKKFGYCHKCHAWYGCDGKYDPGTCKRHPPNILNPVTGDWDYPRPDGQQGCWDFLDYDNTED